MSFWTPDNTTNPTDPRGGFTDHPSFGITTEQSDTQFPGGTSCFYPNGRPDDSPVTAYMLMDDD
jgi:hypothetical protein